MSRVKMFSYKILALVIVFTVLTCSFVFNNKMTARAEDASFSANASAAEYAPSDSVSVEISVTGLGEGAFSGTVTISHGGMENVKFATSSSGVSSPSYSEDSLSVTLTAVSASDGKVLIGTVSGVAMGNAEKVNFSASASITQDSDGAAITVNGKDFSYPVKTLEATPAPATDAPTATPVVTATPTAEATKEPAVTTDTPKPATDAPTSKPTEVPTTAPTAVPTAVPTEAPEITAEPTVMPDPTLTVISTPTAEPTDAPTKEAVAAPTKAPTAAPTAKPTSVPKNDEKELNPISVGAIVVWSLLSLVVGIWIGILIGYKIWKKKSVFMTAAEKKIIGRY